MSTKVRLPVAQDQVTSPSARWGFKENLGKYVNVDRYNFSGAGSVDISTGIISIAASETLIIYVPTLPGHMYQLDFIGAGSTNLTIDMAGIEVATAVVAGANVFRSKAVVNATTQGVLNEIQIVEGAAATATLSGVILTCLDKVSFDLAYLS